MLTTKVSQTFTQRTLFRNENNTFGRKQNTFISRTHSYGHFMYVS